MRNDSDGLNSSAAVCKGFAQQIVEVGGIDIGTTGRLAVNAWRPSRDE